MSSSSRNLNLMYFVSIMIKISVINIKINAYCGIMNLSNINTTEENELSNLPNKKMGKAMFWLELPV